jgi:hypothetical protein
MRPTRRCCFRQLNHQHKNISLAGKGRSSDVFGIIVHVGEFPALKKMCFPGRLNDLPISIARFDPKRVSSTTTSAVCNGFVQKINPQQVDAARHRDGPFWEFTNISCAEIYPWAISRCDEPRTEGDTGRHLRRCPIPCE